MRGEPKIYSDISDLKANIPMPTPPKDGSIEEKESKELFYKCDLRVGKIKDCNMYYDTSEYDIEKLVWRPGIFMN